MGEGKGYPMSTQDYNTPDARTTTGAYTPPGEDPLQSGKSSAELQQDIRQTRSSLDDKLDSLGERLRPKNLMGDVFDTLKEQGSGAAASIGQTLLNNVKRHPLPSAMVGAGLVWLLLADDETEGPARQAVSRFGRSGSYNPGMSGDAHRLRDRERGFPLTDEERRGGGYNPYTGQDVMIVDEIEPLTDDELTAISEIYPEYQEYQTLELEARDYPDHDTSDEAKASRSKLKAARDKASKAAGKAVEGSKDAGGSVASGVHKAASRLGHFASSAASGAGHGLSSAGHGLASAASATGSGLASAASATGSGLASAASATGHGVADASQYVGSTAKWGYREAAKAAAYAADEAPLATGLVGLALGAVVGFLVPGTRTEDEYFGDMADDVKSAAKDVVVDATGRAGDVASATASAAMQRGRELGLEPHELAEKSKRIAEAARKAAEQAAHDEGLAPSQLADKAKDVGSTAAETAKEEATHEAEHSEAKKKAEKAEQKDPTTPA